jgi:hypothetical protein
MLKLREIAARFRHLSLLTAVNQCRVASAGCAVVQQSRNEDDGKTAEDTQGQPAPASLELHADPILYLLVLHQLFRPSHHLAGFGSASRWSAGTVCFPRMI